MKINNIKLSEILKHVYLYDGKLYNKHNNRYTKPSKNGYTNVKINNKTYRLHRLLYQIYNNLEEIPEGLFVDHIDRNPSNNSKENLRLATPSQNVMNSSVYNKYGIKGLRVCGNKYVVSIVKDSKLFRTSFNFSTFGYKKSIEWLEEKRKELHGEYGNNSNINIKTHEEIVKIIENNKNLRKINSEKLKTRIKFQNKKQIITLNSIKNQQKPIKKSFIRKLLDYFF